MRTISTRSRLHRRENSSDERRNLRFVTDDSPPGKHNNQLFFGENHQALPAESQAHPNELLRILSGIQPPLLAVFHALLGIHPRRQ